MEFLKPAASLPSAWWAPHLAASSSYAPRRAPFVLRLPTHGPHADTATRTGTAALLLTRAAGALAPISSTSSPSRFSTAWYLASLHRPEAATARTRWLAARLGVLFRSIASGYAAAADTRLPELATYRRRPGLLPPRALPGSAYPAAADARLPALETYSGRPRLPPLRALPGSSIPSRRRNDASHTTRCTPKDGTNTTDKKAESKASKMEHLMVFSLVCIVRYAETKGILAMISAKVKLPSKVTALIALLFVAVKSLYDALKETKDIEEVLGYFRKVVKQGEPPVQDGTAKP